MTIPVLEIDTRCVMASKPDADGYNTGGWACVRCGSTDQQTPCPSLDLTDAVVV